MKKFKIQSFIQKNVFKKNILNNLFSKFFSLFNMSKSSWKISFNQFNKKNIENSNRLFAALRAGGSRETFVC